MPTSTIFCPLPRFCLVSVAFVALSLGASSCKRQRDGRTAARDVALKKVERTANRNISTTAHAIRSPRQLDGGIDPEEERIGQLLLKGELNLSDFWVQHSGRPPSTTLLGWLLDRDPLLACRLVEDAPDAGAGMNARNALAQAWGRREPLKCLDWIASLSLNPTQRMALQQSMVSQASYQLANDGDPAVWFVILDGLKKPTAEVESLPGFSKMRSLSRWAPGWEWKMA